MSKEHKDRIFLNYRRQDALERVDFLAYILEQAFSAAGLFRDLSSLKGGQDFAYEISSAIEKSDVFLVVIGPHWQQMFLERNNDPHDFVRIEIQAALESQKKIIPILVNGAEMPQVALLPSDLAPFLSLNAFRLRSDSFVQDVSELIGIINDWRARRREASAFASVPRWREDIDPWFAIPVFDGVADDKIIKMMFGDGLRDGFDGPEMRLMPLGSRRSPVLVSARFVPVEAREDSSGNVSFRPNKSHDISRDDAELYVRWLSNKYRKRYRLLTREETEQVHRDGSSYHIQPPYAVLGWRFAREIE